MADDVFRQRSGAVPDARYWNRMSRAARMIDGDMMELRSYLDARLRVLMIAIAVMLVFAFGVSGLYFDRSSYLFESQWDDFRYIFFYESYLRDNFNTGTVTYDSFEEYRTIKYESREVYFWTIASGVIVQAAFLVGMLLIALFWPKQAPMRLDRVRGVAYTVRRGLICEKELSRVRFQVLMAPHGAIPSAVNGEGEFGYVSVLLPYPDGTLRNIGAGSYPPTHMRHNADLAFMMRAFADGAQADWVENLRPRGFLLVDLVLWLNKFSLRRSPDLNAAFTQERG